MQTIFPNLHIAITQTLRYLKDNGEIIETCSWQSIKSPRPMFEVYNICWTAPIPQNMAELSRATKPDLNWVNIHFKERVGGKPLNPGESYKSWPGYSHIKYNDENFRKGELFSHTYMERYWPKFTSLDLDKPQNKGIRYEYGDLWDVINLLIKDPYTRQAYLPIFFPEDTGAVEGQRIPCTLGYLLSVRNGKLNIEYYMRSCDAIRHFRNDIFLTCALLKWVKHKLEEADVNFWAIIEIGSITFKVGSLHVFDKEKNLL